MSVIKMTDRNPGFYTDGFKPRFYIASAAIAILLTAFGMIWGSIIKPIDQALIYLAGVVFVAIKFGQGPSLLYSFLSVTGFNFFFIPPVYTFNVYDRSYWMTFAVMLITGFVIADQASRLKLQAILSHKRERNTQTFYALTKKLASMSDKVGIVHVAATHIAEILNVGVSIWMPDSRGQLQSVIGDLPEGSLVKEAGVLQWCFENSRMAGRNTEIMPSASGLYFPMVVVSGTLGVMSVTSASDHLFSADETALLETFVNLLASALERVRIAEIAEQSKLDAEREKLRTMLLSSVSHDLRTPLASITGASSAIVADIDQLPRDIIRDLGRSINKEAERLSHIVTNLLEVTRLESGTVQLNKQPYFIEELVGSAIGRLESVLVKHKVIPYRDESLPLVLADGVLIEQVLINLLENAVRYTPEGSTIAISAIKKDANILIRVADDGPGIPVGYEKKIFDKFYSIGRQNVQKGTGLGLAICTSIIKAHQGEIWVEPSPQGGACFCFTLPVAHTVPQEVRHVANG